MAIGFLYRANELVILGVSFALFFLAILRLYTPTEAAIDKSWKPGNIEKVKRQRAVKSGPANKRMEPTP